MERFPAHAANEHESSKLGGKHSTGPPVQNDNIEILSLTLYFYLFKVNFMNGNSKVQIFETLIQIILGITVLFLPFFFLTTQTDIFVIPKQLLLISLSLLGFILYGIKMIFDKKLTFRHTPLDLPIYLFILFILLSALFSTDRFESLIYALPFLFVGIFYFVFINNVKKYQELYFFILIFIFSSVALSIFQVLTFFKIYPLPFISSHVPTFSPTGSLMDSGIFILTGLLITLSLAIKYLRQKDFIQTGIFGLVSVVNLIACVYTIYTIVTKQQYFTLPFLPSFQIAFSELSADTGRVLQGFLLGSGYGTFSVDFTRFKPVYFNNYENLWYLTFNNSFSFILELITTTGILGFLTFLFLIIKTLFNPKSKLSNPFFLSGIGLLILSLILPFSYFVLTLLILVFAFLSSFEGFKKPKETEFSLLAIRKFFQEDLSRVKTSLFVPISFLVLIVIFTAASLYYVGIYTLSDYYFKTAINAANNNNGNLAYQMEIKAINTFPYRDIYYTIFSQTNMQLANSLATLEQNQTKDQIQQTQNTIINLIQQAINTSRTATSLSPLKVTNWQNLASVYKSIIGIGKNADTFAIASVKQAIILDPNNPQEYITLGGIYYQLGDYTDAIIAFQNAINLKTDYANAYYNLGHAYEQKNDLSDALAEFQNVKILVANDPTNLNKINQEIKALQDQMNNTGTNNKSKVKTTQATPAPVAQPLTLPSQTPVSSTSSK